MVANMPTITLKNLPLDLHRQLKIRAKAHHRSLNGEVIASLEATTKPTRTVDQVSILPGAREVRKQFKRQVGAREIAAWKMQGRLVIVVPDG